MSAFLGPIHNWLFGKILLQDELLEEFLAYGSSLQPELREKVDKRYGTLEQGALEDIVDEMNIHGWLQQRVNLVEERLSYVVTELTKDQEVSMKDINQIAFSFGVKHAIGNVDSAETAWERLNNCLLDGMPCDHVNEVIKADEEEVIYQMRENIHAKFWTLIDGNVEHYDSIKFHLIQGLLDGSSVQFEKCENGSFRLYR